MLWCRTCGVHVADITNSVNILSKGAIKVETRNILEKNITVQTLINPYKYIFEVLTTHRASCEDEGPNHRAGSWFPGYTWRICTCPHCTKQLGWTFEKVLTNDVDDNNDRAPFHALMLSALLAKTNDFQIAEMTTPYQKSLNLSSTLQPAIVPRASDDSLKLSTTIYQDDTIEIVPLKDSKLTVAPGKIVVLKSSRNVTGIFQLAVQQILPSGDTDVTPPTSVAGLIPRIVSFPTLDMPTKEIYCEFILHCLYGSNENNMDCNAVDSEQVVVLGDELGSMDMPGVYVLVHDVPHNLAGRSKKNWIMKTRKKATSIVIKRFMC
ncbi:unnamed protein product [Arctia plantaginis]|uniref:CULT domain-containing protein n=1 Tax=Arctia plantaginis TaxID=874455 RepID=A0A8S1AXV8_ARCPL|nr:unnamed protein product [Arctia plantaginis]